MSNLDIFGKYIGLLQSRLGILAFLFSISFQFEYAWPVPPIMCLENLAHQDLSYKKQCSQSLVQLPDEFGRKNLLLHPWPGQ